MSPMDDFRQTIELVIPFAERFKARLLELGKTRGKTRCPRHPDAAEPVWIRGRIAGSRNHFAMACDDPACIMRMME